MLFISVQAFSRSLPSLIPLYSGFTKNMAFSKKPLSVSLISNTCLLTPFIIITSSEAFFNMMCCKSSVIQNPGSSEERIYFLELKKFCSLLILTIIKLYKQYNLLFVKKCSKLCSKCLQLPPKRVYRTRFSTFSIEFLTKTKKIWKYTIC